MQDINKKIFPDDLPRLRWACRRGMLELDVLLGKFLEQTYPALMLEEKQQFIDLLTCADPDIIDWLLGHAEPNDVSLLNIVRKIRHHARS